MSSHTTYRLRWPVRIDAAACAAAMTPCSMLPLSEAGDFDEPMFEIGNVAPGITIRGLVPDGRPSEDDFWSLENGVLTFSADLLNRFYRHDDEPVNSVGEPSREAVLLDALARTCGASDGHIVGAWSHEYLENWMPMVWLEGRLLRGFVNGWSCERLGGDFREHDGALKIDLLEVDLSNRSVTIPFQAF